MRDISRFAYLWDGTPPVWRLLRTHRRVSRVTFVFARTGPSLREIVSIREIVDEFRGAPTSDVWRALRGLEQYQPEGEFHGLEADQFAARAECAGLKLLKTTTCYDTYLPISAENDALIIEDEETQIAVVQRMIAAGVRVDVAIVD